VDEIAAAILISLIISFDGHLELPLILTVMDSPNAPVAAVGLTLLSDPQDAVIECVMTVNLTEINARNLLEPV
jgi:hypothetical protein